MNRTHVSTRTYHGEMEVVLVAVVGVVLALVAYVVGRSTRSRQSVAAEGPPETASPSREVSPSSAPPSLHRDDQLMVAFTGAQHDVVTVRTEPFTGQEHTSTRSHLLTHTSPLVAALGDLGSLLRARAGSFESPGRVLPRRRSRTALGD